MPGYFDGRGEQVGVLIGPSVALAVGRSFACLIVGLCWETRNESSREFS